MRPDQKDHMAELALIRAIPDMLHGRIPKGRISNIYKRLQKYVDKILAMFPQVTNLDKIDIGHRIYTFGQKADWEKRQVDITVLLSFVLDLIKNSQFDYPYKIVDALNDAFEFITQSMSHKEELDGYVSEAETASEIWRSI